MPCMCGGCPDCLGAQGYATRRLPNGRLVVVDTDEEREAFERAEEAYWDAKIEERGDD